MAFRELTEEVNLALKVNPKAARVRDEEGHSPLDKLVQGCCKHAGNFDDSGRHLLQAREISSPPSTPLCALQLGSAEAQPCDLTRKFHPSAMVHKLHRLSSRCSLPRRSLLKSTPRHPTLRRASSSVQWGKSPQAMTG